MSSDHGEGTDPHDRKPGRARQPQNDGAHAGATQQPAGESPPGDEEGARGAHGSQETPAEGSGTTRPVGSPTRSEAPGTGGGPSYGAGPVPGTPPTGPDATSSTGPVAPPPPGPEAAPSEEREAEPPPPGPETTSSTGPGARPPTGPGGAPSEGGGEGEPSSGRDAASSAAPGAPPPTGPDAAPSAGTGEAPPPGPGAPPPPGPGAAPPPGSAAPPPGSGPDYGGAPPPGAGSPYDQPPGAMPPPPPVYGTGAPGYGHHGHPHGAPDPRLAGMPPLGALGRRLLARIIDALIVYIPVSLFLILIGQIDDFADTDDTGSQYGWGFFGLLVYLVYEGLMLTRSGQTVGKILMSIRVGMLENGAVPAGGPGWIRAAVYSLPGIVPCIGTLFWLYNVLSCTWDRPFRQCLHDKAARTVVVSTEGRRFTP